MDSDLGVVDPTIYSPNRHSKALQNADDPTIYSPKRHSNTQNNSGDATIYSPNRYSKTLHNAGDTPSEGSAEECPRDGKEKDDMRETVTALLLTAHKGVTRSLTNARDLIREKLKELKEKREEKQHKSDGQNKDSNREKRQPLCESLDDIRDIKTIPPPDVENYACEDDRPLIHPIISATVLSFPYAFKEAGFPLGLIMLIVVAVMVDYSEVLLVQCSILADDISLQSIARDTFGALGSFLMYTMPYLLSLSILVAYNIIIADTATSFINSLLQMLNVAGIGDRR